MVVNALCLEIYGLQNNVLLLARPRNDVSWLWNLCVFGRRGVGMIFRQHVARLDARCVHKDRLASDGVDVGRLARAEQGFGPETGRVDYQADGSDSR